MSIKLSRGMTQRQGKKTDVKKRKRKRETEPKPMAVFSARGSGVIGWLLKCKTNVQLCRVSPWLEVTEGCSNVTCTQSFQGTAASAFPLRIAEEPPFKVDFVIEQWSNRCGVKEKAEGDRETD